MGKIFGYIFTFAFTSSSVLSLVLWILYFSHPEIEGAIDKMAGLLAVVVFVSLSISVGLWCCIVRLITGKWPIIRNTNDDIVEIRQDISLLKSAITDIRNSIVNIETRLTNIEGKHERGKPTKKTPYS